MMQGMSSVGADTLRLRVGRGLLRSPIVLQAGRFLVVGGASYVINISLYAAAIALGLHYLLAPVTSSAIGFTFNFVANHHWTFTAGAGRLDQQIVRFSDLAGVILVLDLA